MSKQCPAFGKICLNCQKNNHVAQVCLKGKQSSNQSIYEVDDDELLIGTVKTPMFKKIHTTEAKCRVQKIKTVPRVEAI